MNTPSPKKSFDFCGVVPPSKSYLNRLLVLSSFSKSLTGFGLSRAQDVLDMEQALADFKDGRSELWCGQAGTVLRFLALRVSRRPGRYILRAHPRLFSRPQEELHILLGALGVKSSQNALELVIESTGWRQVSERVLSVPSNRSSQFASALLLSAWELEFPLIFQLTGALVSRSYFDMTLQMVQRAGMVVSVEGDVFRIPERARVLELDWSVESDLSSAAAIASLAAVGGRAELLNLNLHESLQPDRVFFKHLQKMGVRISNESATNCVVEQTSPLLPVDVCLRHCPDLFPVLSVLCALAEGKSFLREAPHLVFKESNRIEKIRELLSHMERKLYVQGEDVVIEGSGTLSEMRPFEFDASADHRLVMAAAVAQCAGVPVEIKGASSVQKSFPEFLAWANLST